MAAPDNTIVKDDVATSQDIEMITRFNGDLNLLTQVLGLSSPQVVQAGTALFQYKVTGTLSSGDVAEGEEVPLTNYKVTKTQLDPIALKKYRKMTTAEAILKGGYENAVQRTDEKMLAQIRDSILTEFFTFLGNGTSTATGTGLQAVLAQATAKIQDETEKNSDYSGSIVYFVNPYDIADYLGNAQVTTQTVYGMTYLDSFLGVQNIMVTNRVDQNTVYATPVENIHVYGIDFGSLGASGLSYTTMDGSLLGVHHNPTYDRVSAETYAVTGATFLPEYKNYIVKGTIASE